MKGRSRYVNEYRAFRRRPESALVAVLLLGIGCSDDSPNPRTADLGTIQQLGEAEPADDVGSDPPAMSIEQSPEIARVINHEPELPAGSWTIGEVPRLQIGQVDGDEEYLFQDVVHAHRLEDGSILVVNAGGGSVIRSYSPEGEYRTGFGRQGRGPEEFWWVTVQRVTLDTLLLHDITLRRSTLATATDGVIRSWPTASTATPPVYVTDDAQIWVTNQDVNALPEGYHRLYRSFVLGTEDAPGSDTIGHARQDEVVVLPRTGATSRLPAIRVPYGRSATYGYDWVNGRLVTNNLGAHLTYIPVVDRDAVRMEVLLPGQSRSVTQADWDMALDFELELARAANQGRCPDCVKGHEDAQRRMTPPEYMPGYDTLVIDRSGNTWARVYESPYVPRIEPVREWRVLSSSGRWIVSSYLPNEVEPLDIGEDYLLARITIDFDVKAVGLFDLRKRPRR